MNKQQLTAYIKRNQEKRKEITRKIRELSAKRQKYMIEKAKKSGEFKSSFEKNLFDSIRPQMRKKNIKLEEKDLKL